MRRSFMALTLAASLASTAPTGLFDPLWALFSSLWDTKAGCGMDPDGKCVPASKEGCGMDPSGRCLPAPKAGCEMDPSGRCLSAPRAGCELDPYSRCNPGS